MRKIEVSAKHTKRLEKIADTIAWFVRKGDNPPRRIALSSSIYSCREAFYRDSPAGLPRWSGISYAHIEILQDFINANPLVFKGRIIVRITQTNGHGIVVFSPELHRKFLPQLFCLLGVLKVNRDNIKIKSVEHYKSILEEMSLSSMAEDRRDIDILVDKIINVSIPCNPRLAMSLLFSQRTYRKSLCFIYQWRNKIPYSLGDPFKTIYPTPGYVAKAMKRK